MNFHIFLLLYFLDFQRIKPEGEKRPLDSAEVSIQQVPACKSILVNGLADNTTHDAIRLHFENRRNSGGPVERVQFVPKSGTAVVVFQDPAGLYELPCLSERHEKRCFGFFQYSAQEFCFTR